MQAATSGACAVCQGAMNDLDAMAGGGKNQKNALLERVMNDPAEQAKYRKKLKLPDSSGCLLYTSPSPRDS